MKAFFMPLMSIQFTDYTAVFLNRIRPLAEMIGNLITNHFVVTNNNTENQ